MTITAPASLTPTRLRLLLSAAMTLIVLIGAALFYLAYTQLSKTAAEAGERSATAKQSENTVSRLQTLQSDLQSKKDIIDMTSLITANSQNYAYQDRLVNDLTIYANRANVKIRTISFTDPGAGTAAATGAAGTSATAAPTVSSGGLRKATVDITLENPVNYKDLLNFLHYVEQNLTKLKVSRVVMTKSDGGNVTIDVLNLEVYLK